MESVELRVQLTEAIDRLTAEVKALRVSFEERVAKAVSQPPSVPPASPGPPCPDCKTPMVKRTSRQGEVFWGCSNYPTCRRTRPYNGPIAKATTNVMPSPTFVPPSDPGDDDVPF